MPPSLLLGELRKLYKLPSYASYGEPHELYELRRAMRAMQGAHNHNTILLRSCASHMLVAYVPHESQQHTGRIGDKSRVWHYGGHMCCRLSRELCQYTQN